MSNDVSVSDLEERNEDALADELVSLIAVQDHYFHMLFVLIKLNFVFPIILQVVF